MIYSEHEGNEAFEKLGTLGRSSNLLIYITTVFHMKSVTAGVVITVFNSSSSLAPLAGAFVSDSVYGRYATLGFACFSSLLEPRQNFRCFLTKTRKRNWSLFNFEL